MQPDIFDQPWECVSTSNHAHDYRLTRPDYSHLPVHAPFNDHSQQRAVAKAISAVPELIAAARAALPGLILLGNYIGNEWPGGGGVEAFDRCEAIRKLREALQKAGVAS